MPSDSPVGKPDVSETEDGPTNHSSDIDAIEPAPKRNWREEQQAKITAAATAEGLTAESFAHLDEKKILRKMDIRLIPMLALLYLLSFLDRKSIPQNKYQDPFSRI